MATIEFHGENRNMEISKETVQKLDMEKQLMGLNTKFMGLRRKRRKSLPNFETDWSLENKEKG